MELIKMFKKYGRCIKPSKTITTDEFNRFPPIICKDGTFISAQAGTYYKSYPRENLDDFEYETVEVLKNETTEAEAMLNGYTCTYDEYVYDNVPVIIMDAIIKSHGGLDTDAIEAFIKEES